MRQVYKLVQSDDCISRKHAVILLHINTEFASIMHMEVRPKVPPVYLIEGHIRVWNISP